MEKTPKMFFQKRKTEKNPPRSYNFLSKNGKQRQNLLQNLPSSYNYESPCRAGGNTSKIQFQAPPFKISKNYSDNSYNFCSQPFTKQLLNEFSIVLNSRHNLSPFKKLASF